MRGLAATPNVPIVASSEPDTLSRPAPNSSALLEEPTSVRALPEPHVCGTNENPIPGDVIVVPLEEERGLVAALGL